MSVVTMILGTLVALEFFYIMYLETFATTSKATARTFNLTKEELQRKSVSTLLKNLGVYNGFIGIGLLYGIFSADQSKEITGMLLIYIILVALYGSLTSDKKIILKQGGLAIATFITLFF